ncbi:MAG: conserved repeat domain protein [Segetibacter sp.]|nr:conserved repeat domain protein [Segetibacter sp.]
MKVCTRLLFLVLMQLAFLRGFTQSSTNYCFASPESSKAGTVFAKTTVTYNSNNTVTIRTTLAKTFVDNTYGTGVVGWPGNNHKFNHLVTSDMLQLALYDGSMKKMEFKMDYFSESSAYPSGYGTTGVTSNDGEMMTGNVSDIISVKTSLTENFNTYGYKLTENSPSTNSSYSPNSSYPNWIYDVWYEVTIKRSAFISGTVKPVISGLHASPSKTGKDSEPLVPVPCTNTDNGVIGDFVWNDANKNGVQDSNEPGLANVTVTITGTGGFLKSTTTNASGFYQFTGLAAGTYTVKFTTPSSYTPSPANQGGNDEKDSDALSGSVSVTLNAGQTNNSIDAGFYKTTTTGNLTLGNQVWNDFDGDGKRDDNEPGIPGATISLYTDNNGDNMPDGAAIKTTTSDANGKYLFTNLSEGRYIASMPILPGYQQSPNSTTQATSPNPDSDVDDDNNLVRLDGPNGDGGVLFTNGITLTTNQEPTTDGDGANGNLTFDLAECGNAFIGDFVWNDLNGNGIQDAGEPGINGVTVSITFPDGRTATTTTLNYNGNDGYYDFKNLGPGTYKVTFITPPGLTASPANVGDDTKDSDPVNGGPVTVTLIANQSDFTVDAGFYDKSTIPSGNIGDFVWKDLNKNGIQDAGEPGLQGVTVKLTMPNGTTVSTTTNANGFYQFNNLAAGTYTVTFITPSGYAASPANAGSDDTKDSDADNGTVSVTLTANEVNNTIDAGFTLAVPQTGNCEDFNSGFGAGGSDLYPRLPRNGSYQVVKSVSELGGGGYLDIHSPSGGYFLAAHTSNDVNDRIWYTTINVTPGKTYKFCTSVTLLKNLGSGANFILGLYVNGTSIGSGRVTFDWTQICGTYTVPAGVTSIELSVRDPKKGLFFVAIDDICASEAPPAVDCAETNGTGGYYGGFEAGSGNFGSNAGSDLYNGLPRNGSYQVVKSVDELGGGGYLDIHPKSGSYFLAAHTSNDENDRIWYTKVSVIPGQTYNFCTSVTLLKNLGGGANFIVGIYANGTQIGTGSVTFDWTKICGSYTVPAGVTTLELSIRDPKKGLFFLALDDICITHTNGLTLGNYVWNDWNGSGIKDPGEYGIPGTLVSLYRDDNSDNLPDEAAPIATAITDAQGYYKFSGLSAGRYITSIPLLQGYSQSPNKLTTPETSSTPDNNVDDDNNAIRLFNGQIYTNAITLVAGTEPTDDGDDADGNLTLDMALCGNLWIGNFVWKDTNGDGIQNNNEEGIDDAEISILLPDGVTTITSKTYTWIDTANHNISQKGYYDIPRAGPGTYTLTFKTPDGGFKPTIANQGGDDELDSDPENGTVTVVLTPTSSNFTVDAGFTAFQPAQRSANTSEVAAPAKTGVGNCNLKVALEPKNPLCFNNRTGSVIATVTGNVGKVSYTWSNGSTGTNLVNIGEGKYTLTVKDKATGCEVTSDEAILTYPAKLEASVQSAETNGYNIVCKDSKTGIIDLEVKGGRGIYTYQWSNGATTQDLGDVAAGKYIVTIKDAANCPVKAEITLKEPATKLEVSSNVNQPGCDIKTGSIELKATGGVAPYTYTWSNGATTSSIKKLAPGVYTAIVRDAVGCEISNKFEIKEYNLTVTAKASNETLNRSNGEEATTLHAVAAGGSGELSYTWEAAESLTENDRADATVSPKTSTDYKVTVKDAAGCTASAKVSVQVVNEAAKPSIGIEMSGERVRVTPNPSNGNFNVILNGFSGKVDIKVLDASGKDVASKPVLVDSKQMVIPFNLTKLPIGFYIVNIIGAEGSFKEKMIIRHN